jgi:hypothetical protein
MATVTVVFTQNADNSMTAKSTDAASWVVTVPAANTSQTGPQIKRLLWGIMDILEANLTLAR